MVTIVRSLGRPLQKEGQRLWWRAIAHREDTDRQGGEQGVQNIPQGQEEKVKGISSGERKTGLVTGEVKGQQGEHLERISVHPHPHSQHCDKKTVSLTSQHSTAHHTVCFFVNLKRFSWIDFSQNGISPNPDETQRGPPTWR